MPSELRIQMDVQRKDKTRTELIQAATNVFSKHGYHRTLISQIVKEAGFGQGTFYRNFSSKREIFEVIFDNFATEMFSHFSQMSANMPTNVQQYRDDSFNAVVKLASTIEKNRDVARLSLREAISVDVEFEKKVAGIFDRFAQLAQYYLDHAIAKGFARPCRSDVVAQSLMGIGKQLVDGWWKGQYGDLPLEKLIEEVIDFTFLGFGQPVSKQD